MTRLSGYLVSLFFKYMLAILGIAAVLIWLIQCLRIFDVVAVKGQGLITLAGQAALGLPPLLIVFFYVCVGIGLARGLRELQFSQELHAIHSGRRLSALWSSIGIYGAICTLVVLIASNFIDPYATRQLSDWTESIAADLVGRTLRPHRFSEVVPGVVIAISGRQGAGEVTDFFADDARDPAMRRTYIAKSATIQADGEDYVINMRDGALQYRSDDNEFSQVAFDRYMLSMDRLVAPVEDRDVLKERDSLQLLERGLKYGFTSGIQKVLGGRLSEGLRVVGMCLLVAALAAFPNASRRRFRMPNELVVLIAAFVERAISTYAPVGPFALPFAGAACMTLLGLVILSYRLHFFRGWAHESRVRAWGKTA